jgi:hypothetical protein
MSEWQPIETAPKNGEEILVWQHGFAYMLAHWDLEAKCWARYYMNDEPGLLHPSYWQRLSPPPQKQPNE